MANVNQPPPDSLLQLLRRYPALLMLCVATALLMLGQGVVGPVLPLYAKSFNVSAASVGLTLTVYGLARMLLNIPVGIVSDRIGRRPVLIAGPVIVCVSSVLSGTAGSLEELLVWRFFSGAGAALFQTGAAVYLTDIAEPGSRARMMGLNQGSLLFGVSLGPALGGFVAEFFNFRAAFFLIAALSGACGVWGFFALPETHGRVRQREAAAARRSPSHSGRREARLILLSVPFFFASMISFSGFFSRAGERSTILPLLAVDRFDLSPGEVGLIFTMISVINLVMVPFAGSAADRFGRKAVILPSAVICVVAVVMVALSSSVAFLIFAQVVQGIGSGLMGPAPAAYAADIAPAGSRGLAMGVFRTYGDLGTVVGPPLMGYMADHAGYNAALYLNGVLIAVIAAGFGLLTRDSRHERIGQDSRA